MTIRASEWDLELHFHRFGRICGGLRFPGGFATRSSFRVALALGTQDGADLRLKLLEPHPSGVDHFIEVGLDPFAKRLGPPPFAEFPAGMSSQFGQFHRESGDRLAQRVAEAPQLTIPARRDLLASFESEDQVDTVESFEIERLGS